MTDTRQRFGDGRTPRATPPYSLGRVHSKSIRVLLSIAVAMLITEIAWNSASLLAGPSTSTDGAAAVMGTGMSVTGVIKVQGTSLTVDGVPIQLFGVNDDMGFIYTYWKDYGRNYNFPTFDGTIAGVSSADQFWQQYFRYFLHYQQKVAGSTCSTSSCNPNPNLLRVTVGWDFGGEDSYNAWKNDPAGYFADFDAMVKWAKAAGVYVVPMLMQSPNDRSYIWEYFDTSSSRYAHLVQFERGMMTKYANEPTIAMWDVYNEADVSLPYWPSHGGFSTFKAWEQRLVNDVRSATSQLLTLGHAMTSAYYFFPNDALVSAYDQTWYNAFTGIQGVDVTHIHVYGTAEGPSNVYLVDWLAQWAKAVGKPMFIGELGYNRYPGPGPVSYGHWPWYLQTWRGEDAGRSVGPVAEMTWVDNGRGAYSDYPYSGSLPNYPSTGAFDFAVSVSSGSDSVSQGSSISTTATATLTSGATHAVNFSASGLPSGATASFSSTGCSPTCASTLTISAALTTPAGTYNVLVTGTDGALTRTAGYALTVRVPAICSSLTYPSTRWQRVWYDATLTTCIGDGPDEPNVQFDNDWGTGIVAGIRNSDIGFHSGRTLSLNAGTYTFTVGSDDGSRLWVDGTTCVDMWIQQAYTEGGCTRTFPSAGDHPVRIDYYEGTWNGDGGQARVRFTSTGGAADTTPPAVGSIGPTAAVVNGPTSFSVLASDNVAVASCTFSWDAISQGTMAQTGATFTKTFTPTGTGTHTAGVACVDVAGNTGTSTTIVSVTTIGPAVDTIPPATIADLRASSSGVTSVVLQWTAPGDDGTTGTATWYDLRYGTSGAITEATYDGNTHYQIGFPKPAGSLEQATVTGLQPGIRYWFALRASDEVPAWSAVSNSPTAIPQTDVTPPAVITDLTVVAAGSNTVTLRWTAPGDDGIAGRAVWYDLRYSRGGAITDSNFDAARHYEIAFPAPGGSIEQVTVSGLRAGTRYWFALRAADEVPLWSRASASPFVVTLRSPTSGTCVFCPFDSIDTVLGTDGLARDILTALVFVAASGGIVLRRRLRKVG